MVIVNHRYGDDATLALCETVKRISPTAPLVAASSGPAIATFRSWAQQWGHRRIVEKPLVEERIYGPLTELLAVTASARQLRIRAIGLSMLKPAGAQHSMGEAQAELFDAAMLYTDIWDSSRLSTQMARRLFFDLLTGC